MEEEMTEQEQVLFVGKKEKLIWGAALLLMWSGVGYLLYISHGDLTIDQLLRYKPENMLLAALMLWGLFLLKSVDFILHSSVFYAASGVLFPMPLCFLVNIVGICVTCVIPYLIGAHFGRPLLLGLRQKYPRLREMEELGSRQMLVFTILLRSVGLPVNVASLYLGARRCPLAEFFTGSVLGLLPHMIPYTLMGGNLKSLNAPGFYGAVAAEVAAVCLSLFVLVLMRRRRKRQQAERGL